MKRNAFTLIELIAVIVLLGIILTIAVPTITGVIKGSTKSAFESDAKMVLKAIDYKKLNDNSFDETKLTKENIAGQLGLSSDNYTSINITKEDNISIISIIGTNKWDGFIACGTFQNMRVVENAGDCQGDSIPPVLTLLGDNPVNMYVGNTYIDAGATAIDNLAGNITSKIVISGTVNPNIPGTYTITYTTMDLFENVTTLVRTVNVIDNAYPMITFNPNGNSTYAKTRSTTITATDLGLLDNSSLKYVWSMNAVEPSVEAFTNTYTSGDNITTPIGVTGTYYLWAQASDTAGNRTVLSSNVFNLDNTAPVITMNGSSPITVNKGSTYTDQGATATDNIDTNITVTSTGSVNPSIVGTYTITYNATDSSGNTATPVTRTINVIDVLAPVITLNGSNPTNINVNSTYTDAGATAIDDVDGDVTSRIVVTGTVNPSVVGTYTITYTVKDGANNTATSTRTVNVIDNIVPTVAFGTNGNSTYAKSRSTTVTVSDNVSVNASSLKYLWNTSTTQPSAASFTTSFTNGGTISSPVGVTGSYYLWILAKDTSNNTTINRTNVFNIDNTAPVITLSGSNPITINAGSVYTDAGATATDAHSGISGSVTSTSNVNTSVLGTYTVTYNVSDNAGNSATPVTRTVNVVDNNPPTITANSSSYTITEGTSNAIPGTYFTISQNGLASISSTTCVDTSNGNAAVANTSNLTVGTHVISCTVTKTTGLKASASTTISVEVKITGIPVGTYAVGTIVTYAGQSWTVMSDNGNNDKLILNRLLNASELSTYAPANAPVSTLWYNGYGQPSMSQCVPTGGTYTGTYCYSNYTWGTSYIKATIENWLNGNSIMSKDKQNGGLLNMTYVDDTGTTYNTYIRLITISESVSGNSYLKFGNVTGAYSAGTYWTVTSGGSSQPFSGSYMVTYDSSTNASPSFYKAQDTYAGVRPIVTVIEK